MTDDATPAKVRLTDGLGAWVPVAERMPPPGSVVLVAYRNQLGHWRRIRAEWVPAKTQEADIDNEFGEYDEATDTHYTPEGWYERINNWDDYSSVKVYEGEPSHWMHLPLPPDAPNAKLRTAIDKAEGGKE